jgi:uncharacterized protein YbjT (DUF2867 family)
MSSKFLVTGATGATGGKTVKFLLEAGTQVKAYVLRFRPVQALPCFPAK